MITAPTINVPRSAIMQFTSCPTSWKHGQIVPLDSLMVLPGTTLKCNLGSKIIMNTPIRPFVGEIECEINAFFVPMRLLWTGWKTMFGENLNSAGVPTDPNLEGTIQNNNQDSNIFKYGVAWDSVSAYCGKPVVAANASKHAYATLWKEKAYYLIWSTHYRAAMIQAPFIANAFPNAIGNIGSTTLHTTSGLLQVNKSLDYFTAALQSPQYGSGVTLPLGTTAPVGIIGTTALSSGGHTAAVVGTTSSAVNAGDVAQLTASITGITGYSDKLLVADLSQASAAKVNDIRFAVALQKYQEMGIYGGPWYQGQLMAHYGVTPSDYSLQLPIRLGTINFTLNMSQVTAMADTTIDGTLNPTGSIGAISVTGNNRHLFTKAFDEFGVVMVLLHTRVKNQSYNQGLLREDTRLKRTDFYANEFANIGEVPVYKKEIFVTGDSTDDEVFGYQEAWSDERYRIPVRASGICNPNAGSGIADPSWALVNSFASRPQLNDAFLQEDRNLVASRLFGSSSTHDYIGEFSFAYEKISEVPIHSIPGKLDHVGDM